MKNIPKNTQKYRILILDFGSQYSQLLVRRIREIGTYCELWTWNTEEEKIKQFNPHGIILSGGPQSTTTPHSPKAPEYIFLSGIPILGICYGMHTMTKQLGGKVQTSSKREFGYTKIKIIQNSPLLKKINTTTTNTLKVWMSHEDKITIIPKNFTTIAKTKTCPFVIIENAKKKFYGIQFHPEVTHTQQGKNILKRFITKICQCQSLWKPKNIIQHIIQKIKIKIKNKNDKVILGFSGGIDSLVTAILLKKAIGKRLLCIFIDNGLLQLHKYRQTITFLKKHHKIKTLYMSVQNKFFQAISGITDPEMKRKIIGKTFIEIFQKKASNIPHTKWLAQGTIYSDIIESAQTTTNSAYLIKSHHNVGGIPKTMKIKLIEPIKKLFKDEVRNIGKKLGIPHNLLYQHPFPGPGLSVRILGEVKKEYCNILKKTDAIFINELHKAKLYYKISQAFTIFLPIRSVGIMGDTRKYDWIIALRAIKSTDFMTAKCVNLPHNLLCKISNRIINEIPGISRVVYDISSKPPATIEWE
ncbi:MAG: GMP synthetase [Candidatus Westeberhardia cardiocondylae]|nr:GMP synthetase [Candidatus Westeberhardia cardiocondylae]